MDMALATRKRRLWLSCQRCHRFLTAERTCSSEEASLNDKDCNIKKNLKDFNVSGLVLTVLFIGAFQNTVYVAYTEKENTEQKQGKK